MTDLSVQKIWGEFQSQTCAVCNQKKRAQWSFCSKCYHALPRAMRSDLYKRFFCGYEEAYQAARRWLLLKHVR